MAKKFVSLKIEYTELVESLEADPKLGVSIGQNCFKIKLSISSKGKGKSGGARVITYYVAEDGTVYLLTIYDKSEKENISDRELKEMLSEIE